MISSVVDRNCPAPVFPKEPALLGGGSLLNPPLRRPQWCPSLPCPLHSGSRVSVWGRDYHASIQLESGRVPFPSGKAKHDQPYPPAVLQLFFEGKPGNDVPVPPAPVRTVPYHALKAHHLLGKRKQTLTVSAWGRGGHEKAALTYMKQDHEIARFS